MKASPARGSPSLKGIMAAKKKPLETKPAQLGEARLTVESDGASARAAAPAASSAREPTRCPSWSGCSTTEAKVL